MALTPAFVGLLQKRWMRDDLSTITNTFPDHEDLQGPAGINIPQVMTHFIPKNSVLLTSEEQMRPILATAAATLGTRRSMGSRRPMAQINGSIGADSNGTYLRNFLYKSTLYCCSPKSTPT